MQEPRANTPNDENVGFCMQAENIETNRGNERQATLSTTAKAASLATAASELVPARVVKVAAKAELLEAVSSLTLPANEKKTSSGIISQAITREESLTFVFEFKSRFSAR